MNGVHFALQKYSRAIEEGEWNARIKCDLPGGGGQIDTWLTHDGKP